MVQTQAEESTHHDHHAGGLSQCLLALLLPHFALFGRGDHCSHKSYHRLQIPEKPLNDLSELWVRCIPLQYTRLGGNDLRHPLQHHLLGLGLPGRTPGRRHYTLRVDHTGPQFASFCRGDSKALQQRYQLAGIEGLETSLEQKSEKGRMAWTDPRGTCEVEGE